MNTLTTVKEKATGLTGKLKEKKAVVMATALNAVYVADAALMRANALDTDMDASAGKEKMETLLSTICDYIAIAGIAFAIWGAVQFVMAVRNEDGENKHKAALGIMGGLAMAALKTLLSTAGFLPN